MKKEVIHQDGNIIELETMKLAHAWMFESLSAPSVYCLFIWMCWY